MTSRRDRPRVKLQAIPKFPADVVAGDGITIVRAAAVYTFSSPGVSLAQSAAEDAADSAAAAAASAAAAAAIAAAVAPGPHDMAGSGTIPTDKIFVNTTQSGAITLVTPESVAWAAANNKFATALEIFDASGNASVNNVTINFNGAQTANGHASRTISTNYGGFRFRPKTGGGWIIV